MSIFQRVFFVFFGLCLMATAGCGGDAFGAAGGEQPDANSDVQVDSDAGFIDSKPEADAHHDAKPEADAHQEAEATAPDAPDEPETSVPEPAPEAGEDVIEEPDVQVADVVAEDGPPLTLCQQYGTDGAVTVVVKVGNVPPSGKVLALYGTVKHTVADAGANLPYGVWKFGQNGETQIVALPIAELHNLELLFAWGFATPGDTNWNGMGWTMRCTATGCNVNDMASVCAGKEFLGSFDHGQFKPDIGTCTSKLNGSMTVTEVDCFVN